MDGAWALYEAWMMLQIGHADTALVYGFGKPSAGNMREVLTIQLDPYYLAPTGVDCIATAGLQARALLDRSDYTERDMAEVASRSRRAAMSNPYAQVKKDVSADELLNEPYWVDPLRKHDCPPITDGCAAVHPRRRRPGEGHVRPARLDPGHRAPHRAALLRDP